MNLDEFIRAGWAKIKLLEKIRGTDKLPILYEKGTKVKTKSNGSEYISLVIGSGKKGIIETEEPIPLVIFNPGTRKERSYYIHQKNLIPCES